MRPERQRGFAIITAIFILVVLAALGGFVATISTTQSAASAMDVQSAYAYQAARAGTEWGIDKVLNGVPVTACPATTLTLSGGMTVPVCLQSVASGAATEIGLGTIWRITATACNITSGGSCPGDLSNPNYVERQLTVLVEK